MSHSTVSNRVLAMVCSLVTWEQPWLSAVALVTSNCLFWLVVSWNRRFFSIVGILGLVIFVYRMWVDHIWPEIRVPPPEDDDEEDNEEWIRVHPQHVSVPELATYMNDFHSKLVVWWNNLMRLRETNHLLFCLLGCAFFSFTAFVGHMVPGVVIIYILVLCISLGPGIGLHLIPTTIYDQLAGLFVDDATTDQGAAAASKKSYDTDSDLDEFLPETSPEVLRQLSLQHDSVLSSMSSFVPEEEDADDPHLATIRELGMDSFVCEGEESSLYTGLGGFPSVEEENESDLEDDISPSTALPPVDEAKNGMHFVPTHFKEDSSESESDAVFTEGLSFAPIAEGKEPPEGNESTTQKDAEAAPHKKVSTSSDFDDELLDFEILEDTDIS